MKELIKSTFIPPRPEQQIAIYEKEYRAAIERVLQDLETKGLLGKHELFAVPRLGEQTNGGSVGEVSGWLFGFSGRMYSESNSQPTITIAWRPNIEQRISLVSAVPVDKLIIKEGSDEKPTITYQFHLPHFLQLRGGVIGSIEYPHPNNYLTSEGLIGAVIEADHNTLKQIETLQFGQPLIQKG